MVTKNKRLSILLLSTGLLLLIPLIAMQFTDQVNWSVPDFLVMGTLLVGTGLGCGFVLSKVPKLRDRIIICVVIIATFFLIWAELAVGIFGTPFAGS